MKRFAPTIITLRRQRQPLRMTRTMTLRTIQEHFTATLVQSIAAVIKPDMIGLNDMTLMTRTIAAETRNLL
jgi:hypothetical protein